MTKTKIARPKTRTKKRAAAQPTLEQQGEQLLAAASRLAKVPGGEAVLRRLGFAIGKLAPADPTEPDPRLAAIAISEAHAYLEDAPEQIVKLLESQLHTEDRFEVFASHASVLMCVRRYVADAMAALAPRHADGAS